MPDNTISNFNLFEFEMNPEFSNGNLSDGNLSDVNRQVPIRTSQAVAESPA
ncbi:hypothetical protein N9219_02930 [bacterium]|nr:hypothetical protein [bacterium]